MFSPYYWYNRLSTMDGINDLAHFILFEKYILQNLRGHKKKFMLETTDMESALISLNGGTPLPGLIHTFIYKGKPIEVIIEKAKQGEYSDYVPLVFSLGIGPDFFTGINLNVLPSDVRLSFLQIIYETFYDFFENADKLAQNGTVALNKRLIEQVQSSRGKELIKYLNDLHKAKYSFAYRKYKYEHIMNLRMIEYSEWRFIPFYRPKNAFRQMNYDKLHNLYYQKLNE